MGNYSKGNYITIAIRQGKSMLLETLIQEDIDPNFRSLEGLGPLHEAVRAHKTHKNKETTLLILRILLNAGCQEQQQNNDGQTYMNYARDKGYLHEEDIDEILEEIMNSTTPKQTIETSPEEKQNQIFSIQSGSVHPDNNSESSEDSQISQNVEEEMLNYSELSNEMYQWARQVDNERNRTWNLVSPFFEDVQKIVSEFYGTIQIIGSFACQLWLPSSDIDFLIIIPDGGQSSFLEDMTDCIHKRIANLKYHSSIRIILSYKLPLIKLILLPQFEKIEIELFLSSKNNIASRYVAYSNQVIGYSPDVVVIYYVLRRLLAIKRLHDHRSGGLKAYALFLLIYQMWSQYSYPCVAQFLEHFSYYYGYMYEFQTQQNREGNIEYHINITDPLNSENNMGGKKTDIELLQQMMRKIYIGLHTGSKGSKLSYIAEILKFI